MSGAQNADQQALPAAAPPPAAPVAPPPATPTIGGRLIASLEDIAAKIAILRVTTVIGAVNNGQVAETPDGMLQTSFNAAPLEVACTTLDMALGNVTQVRSQAFCDNAAYAKLHDDGVALARAVRGETMDLILKGVEAVKSMAKL